MVLKSYTELWDEIKEQIELTTGNKVIKYDKDFIKEKFKTDDDLPLGKILNIPVCVVIIRGGFEEDSTFYHIIILCV